MSYRLLNRCALATAIGVACMLASSTRAQEAAVQHAKSLSLAFRSASEAVTPSVVKITARTKARTVTSESRENPYRGTPFENFFEDFFEEGPGGRQYQIPQQEGLGSGVIVDAGGVILTNNHVVEGADELIITLQDGRQLEATAEDVMADAQTDLAIIRVAGAENLPAARLGDSDALEVGDWVIAIGNPFGYESTVSAGIISGKGRDISGRIGRSLRSRFLQTDAAINPGNSGGPLVNLDGEVVGVNTAIATRSGGYQGLGFAVPINIAKWVSGQLMDGGVVQRAWLGIEIADLTAEIAPNFGLPPGAGVAVTRVVPDSPADAAGLQVGDVLTSFGGRPVASTSELQELAQLAPIGEAQPVEVVRQGRGRTVSVMMQAFPEDPAQYLGGGGSRGPGDEASPAADSYESPEFGFEASYLTAAQAEANGVGAEEGVYVVGVDGDGPAAGSSLRVGMKVLYVGDREVGTLEEFVEAMEANANQERVLLLVKAGLGRRYVAIRRN